jgi:hypothetical protein
VTGKRSRPPEPDEGVALHMPEPMKSWLRDLRRRLVELPADQPLPAQLRRALNYLITWADFRIDRLLTREQISYQRSYVVLTLIERYIAQHGTKRGSRKYAYHAAAAELTGPYAGDWRTMQEDFLFEQRNAVGTDRRSVRYREKLQQLADEANEKRARSRKR